MDVGTTIPLSRTIFLDRNGQVTEAWWRFLITLYNRTGGSQGNDTKVITANVADLQVDVNTFSFAPDLAALLAGVDEDRMTILGGAASEASISALSQKIDDLMLLLCSGGAHAAVEPLPDSVSMAVARQDDDMGLAPVHGQFDQSDLHAAATPTSAGFMSAADKTKLDSL